MDANLAALLTVVVTSITTIVVSLINLKKSGDIKKSVDSGNAATQSVHTIVNGRTEALMAQLAEKNAEIQRLNRLLPPPPSAS